MEKDNYLVIQICHERYAFETNVTLHYETTISDICKSIYLYREEDGIWEDGIFIIDKSVHSEIDNKWTYPGFDRDKVQHIHLDCLMIIPLTKLFDDKGCSWIWGNTENKFGLLDIKRGAKE